MGRRTDTSIRGRVLLVDDDPLIRSAYSRVIASRGHEVLVAADATVARALLATEAFDAVLSDIRMPQMSGIELLRGLRAAGNGVPVVLMTGHANLDEAVEAVGLGALDFVRKPVEIDRLASTIERAVERSHHDRGLREAGERLEAERDERVRLSTALDEALAGLWMANQPIVSAASSAPVAFEALMRSRSSALPNPLAILEAAERLGRLVELGRTVRARIAEGMAELPSGALRFVNLHPRDLLDEELYSPETAFARAARSIVLEITERTSLDCVPDLDRRIAALRALGFRLAVDDLGAGYAGLAALAELEPEVVKLDASLVRGIESDPRRRRLLSALVEFCRCNGTIVVAEGVEQRAERDALLALGCDWLQGYHFARPGPGFPMPVAQARD